MLERLYLFLDQLGQIGILTRDFFRYLLRRPFESRALIEQLDNVGYRSLNVVNLTAIFSGMVLALQMGQFLEKFGAKIYVSRIMGLSLLREMGPVLAALMIAARVGAGFSAELGTMKVTEQIDAMRALGTSPIKKLVVPRVLATIIMMSYVSNPMAWRSNGKVVPRLRGAVLMMEECREPRSNLSAQLLLWVVVVGMFAALDTQEFMWFLNRAHGFASNLAIENYVQLRDTTGKFIHFETAQHGCLSRLAATLAGTVQQSLQADRQHRVEPGRILSQP